MINSLNIIILLSKIGILNLHHRCKIVPAVIKKMFQFKKIKVINYFTKIFKV